jgi:hypothetical protein
VNIKLLNGAEIKPNINPYGHPHMNPIKSTGICIGKSILPICGICPVRNGSTIANASPKAVITSFLVDIFIASSLYQMVP